MKGTDKLWVIVESHNEYNQYGDYFVAVFRAKPDKIQIEKLELSTDVDHLLTGGGRREYENVWYKLIEISPGEKYYED